MKKTKTPSKIKIKDIKQLQPFPNQVILQYVPDEDPMVVPPEEKTIIVPKVDNPKKPSCSSAHLETYLVRAVGSDVTLVGKDDWVTLSSESNIPESSNSLHLFDFEGESFAIGTEKSLSCKVVSLDRPN